MHYHRDDEGVSAQASVRALPPEHTPLRGPAAGATLNPEPETRNPKPY